MAASKKSPIEKAVNKKVNQTKRKAKNKAKKAHPGYYIIAVLFLVLGFAASYYALGNITAGDAFEIKGNKETVVSVGDVVSYKDEGIKYISLGKDLSASYDVQTNMTKDSSGNYTCPTDKIGEYYIIYTAKGGRCDQMTLYRTFKVTE